MFGVDGFLKSVRGVISDSCLILPRAPMMKYGSSSCPDMFARQRRGRWRSDNVHGYRHLRSSAQFVSRLHKFQVAVQLSWIFVFAPPPPPPPPPSVSLILARIEVQLFYLRRSRQVYEPLTLLYYISLLRAYTTSKSLYMESKVVGYENLGFLMRSAVCLPSAVSLLFSNKPIRGFEHWNFKAKMFEINI